MKILFQKETTLLKILLSAPDTWMCLMHGEGEKEIANQGWLTVNSFSQETEANVQSLPWIGKNEPKLRTIKTKSQVQDAHDILTQLPFFSFFKKSSKKIFRTESKENA